MNAYIDCDEYSPLSTPMPMEIPPMVSCFDVNIDLTDELNLLEQFEHQLPPQPAAAVHDDIQLQIVDEFLAKQQQLQRASEEEIGQNYATTTQLQLVDVFLAEQQQVQQASEEEIGRNYATTSTSDALAQCILLSGINEADGSAQPRRRSDDSAQQRPCVADELCNFAVAATGVTFPNREDCCAAGPKTKVKCKYCDEYITRANIARHVDMMHIYCRYCNVIHSAKAEYLKFECTLFTKFWHQYYKSPSVY